MTNSSARFSEVVLPVIAALFCWAGCSKSPVVVSASGGSVTNIEKHAAKPMPELERVQVSVTNTRSTLIGFTRKSPAPWDTGNNLSFHFGKPQVPGQNKEEVSWRVVNMHAENFFEITRRLKISAVEVHVWHTDRLATTIQEVGQPERPLTIDQGYAVVTDSRIPRNWYLSEPGVNGGRGKVPLDSDLAQLKAAYPGSFRASP